MSTHNGPDGKSYMRVVAHMYERPIPSMVMPLKFPP